MSAQVTTYPDKVVKTSPSEISKWSAIFQPMKFTFQRKDYVIGNIVNSAGYIRINYTVDQEFDYSLGDTVYVNSGQYDGTGVISFIAISGLYIIVGIPFNGNSSGGFLNSVTFRTNYYISIKCYKIESTQYVLLGKANAKPNAKGLCEFDASPFVRSIVDLSNKNSYSNVNEALLDMGGRFNFKYVENYNGAPTGDYSAFSNNNIRYWTASAKQLQTAGGFNMSPYVTFPPDTASPPADASKAKFVGDFVRPTYFKGFPFAIGFIYSENVSAFECYRKELRKNINGASVNASSDLLDYTQSRNLNALSLTGGYGGSTKTVDVWLECDPAKPINTMYSLPSYVSESYSIVVSNTDIEIDFLPPSND